MSARNGGQIGHSEAFQFSDSFFCKKYLPLYQILNASKIFMTAINLKYTDIPYVNEKQH
jgi:hypothetical protein